ncbi:MAG TPA: class I SAM-dependent methyltransferase [Povalibacter sp.]|uniref:class I SAM-dependent methyltransferase n=1 Tax=Povalibacter sp. TaxID=1962978 RepID=UPI002BB7067A|nr:class I SAM-dependent methyltransferase [Povalibacter sp.]HMN45223.1 class I SAM-dependent methyltransferase [Povalibacter sp.]
MSSHSNDDPALETLFLPIRQKLFPWPHDGALFLRARSGASLRADDLPGLVCEQTFKPDADALERAGFHLNSGEHRRYPLVLLLPPRQREEARALLARAVDSITASGHVIVCQANNEGARSTEKDLERLAGPLDTLTKHHCRVFWTGPLNGPVDHALAEEWRSLDAPRRIADGRFLSRPGIFAWDRIDAASALLAAHLPANLAGDAADLGAGFGYLSAELLARCPRIRSLDLYEAESRALDLARENLSTATVPVGCHWHDVTTGLPRKYDVIVTNPPFHASTHHDRPDIGRRFIAIAAQSLKPGGRLWLVANRHLPYESVLDARFGSVRTVTQSGGFKIIEGTRAA